MLKEFEVTVTHTVKVIMDKSKFTPEFNKDFRTYFFNFDGLEDHAKHIAQMEARGMIGFDHFVEGYGDIREMGIEVKVTDQYEEIDSEKDVLVDAEQIDGKTTP